MEIFLNASKKANKSMQNYQQLRIDNNNNNNNEKKQNVSYKCFLGEFHTQLYWGNLIGLLLFHIFCVYGFIVLARTDFWFCIIYGYIVSTIGGIGVVIGAHRFYTHRTYKAKLPLQILILMLYSIAGQNNLFDWVRDHRVHHKFSETDGDPHDSRRGFWFAHVGWLCLKKKIQVIESGKTVDMSDLYENKLTHFYIRHFIWIKLIFWFLIPTSVPPLLFNRLWLHSFYLNLIRYAFTLHFTWSINSVAHLWGTRPYNNEINPVESEFASYLSLGEGYHNYHHTFPTDYRAAELGSKINVCTRIIDTFAKIGWAYDLKSTSNELVKKYINSKGDGTWQKKF